MKKTRKLLTILSCLALFCVAASAHAVVFESGIPGVGVEGAAGAPLPSLPRYINFLYVFVLGMVGIAAFVSLVVWGTVWVATGIVDKKALALESIKNTFIGIGIALTAYIILNTINPDFITFSNLTLKKTVDTSVGSIGATCAKMVPGKEASAANITACNEIAGCCWGIDPELASYGSTVKSCIPSPCE